MTRQLTRRLSLGSVACLLMCVTCMRSARSDTPYAQFYTADFQLTCSLGEEYSGQLPGHLELVVYQPIELQGVTEVGISVALDLEGLSGTLGTFWSSLDETLVASEGSLQIMGAQEPSADLQWSGDATGVSDVLWVDVSSDGSEEIAVRLGSFRFEYDASGFPSIALGDGTHNADAEIVCEAPNDGSDTAVIPVPTPFPSWWGQDSAGCSR